ncbi:MAG TPA: calcium-binding protein [Thermoleophilaceae bacterium]|nr:calcium-binding protein [Thermoleophilaceae bacterium]
MRTRLGLAATIVTVAAGAALLPGSAAADNSIFCSPGCDIVVNSAVDEPDAQPGDGACATLAGDCTLRAAVQEGNTAGVANVLVPRGDYVLTRHGLDDDASHGDLDVSFHGRLIGAGVSRTVVDGDDADRVFDLHIGEVEVSHLAVRHGRATDGPGGGIRADRGFYARLRYLYVTDNEAVATDAPGSGYGGGIAGRGDTLVDLDQVSYNRAVNGAGMYWAGEQATTFDNSFIGNHASGDGGGIYLDGVDSGIENTTLSANTAAGHGGGAFLASPGSGFLLVAAATIASNWAPTGNGGGVWIDGLAAGDNHRSVRGSILAGNHGSDCAGPATLVSLGGNIDGDGTCGFADATDLAEVDPGLEDPEYNGGPTRTRALEPGSPAIDLWTTECSRILDQRLVPRPDGACDSGAFEVAACCPAYEPGYVPVEEQPPPPPREGDCGVLRFGTPGGDLLVGDRGHNQMYGRAGDDRIFGRSQSDCLYGGAGNDLVRGGEGTDLLVGFTGDDHLSGGDGEDVVRGGRGRDRILGGADEDRLLGGPAADWIKGGDGYDTIDAGGGDDTIDASGGGLDTVACGPGEDSVRAKRGERLTGCEHVRYVG